jgi:cyclic lactone autoinducer peptide
MKNIIVNTSELVAKTALKVTKIGANSACMLIAYQEKLPENAKKLRKF